MSWALGNIVATPGVVQLAREQGIDLVALLLRHAAGDWGDVDDHDRKVNDQAARTGTRILSVYGEGDDRVWVITEAATDACPGCFGELDVCEPSLGVWIDGMHFRNDLPLRRLTTTVLLPVEY
jgi:hypothetical protein